MGVEVDYITSHYHCKVKCFKIVNYKRNEKQRKPAVFSASRKKATQNVKFQVSTAPLCVKIPLLVQQMAGRPMAAHSHPSQTDGDPFPVSARAESIRPASGSARRTPGRAARRGWLTPAVEPVLFTCSADGRPPNGRAPLHGTQEQTGGMRRWHTGTGYGSGSPRGDSWERGYRPEARCADAGG